MPGISGLADFISLLHGVAGLYRHLAAMGVQQIAVLLLHQCQPAVAVVPANIRGPSHRSVLHGGNGGAKIGFQHQSTVFLGDLSDIAYRPGVVLGKGLVEFLIAQSGHSRFLSAACQQHQHRRQQDHPSFHKPTSNHQ